MAIRRSRCETEGRGNLSLLDDNCEIASLSLAMTSEGPRSQ